MDLAVQYGKAILDMDLVVRRGDLLICKRQSWAWT